MMVKVKIIILTRHALTVRSILVNKAVCYKTIVWVFVFTTQHFDFKVTDIDAG